MNMIMEAITRNKFTKRDKQSQQGQGHLQGRDVGRREGRVGEIETSSVVASLILNCQPKDESFTKAIINPRKTKESRGDK